VIPPSQSPRTNNNADGPIQTTYMRDETGLLGLVGGIGGTIVVLVAVFLALRLYILHKKYGEKESVTAASGPP